MLTWVCHAFVAIVIDKSCDSMVWNLVYLRSADEIRDRCDVGGVCRELERGASLIDEIARIVEYLWWVERVVPPFDKDNWLLNWMVRCMQEWPSQGFPFVFMNVRLFQKQNRFTMPTSRDMGIHATGREIISVCCIAALRYTEWSQQFCWPCRLSSWTIQGIQRHVKFELLYELLPF